MAVTEKNALKVSVVDERSEIAACYLGVAQNDIGNSSDVLDNCPKSLGMRMLLRSMSPDVIAVDELGGEKRYRGTKPACELRNKDTWQCTWHQCR